MDSSIFDRSSSDKITINRKDFELVQGYLRKVLELMENFGKNEDEETQEVEEQFYAEFDEDPESFNDAPMSDINECEIDIKEEEITSSSDQALKVVTQREESDWEDFEDTEDSEEEEYIPRRSSGKRVIKPPTKFSAKPLEVKRRIKVEIPDLLDELKPQSTSQDPPKLFIDLPNGKVKCIKCGSAVKASYQEKHRAMHKDLGCIFKCDLCSFQTYNKSFLRTHMGTSHRSDVERAKVPQMKTQGRVKCSKETSVNLLHVKEEHQSHPPVIQFSSHSPSTSTARLTSQKFKCHLCPFTTRVLDLFNKHLKKVHNSSKRYKSAIINESWTS